MTYEAMPLDELVRSFIDILLQASAKPDDDFLDKETAKIGTAIVARGDAGAAALSRLLDDPREDVQLLAAVELTELDPYGAAPTLERLHRESAQFEIRASAGTKLQNNRLRGLLPAR